MRTAKEMYDFVIDNGYVNRVPKRWLKKHFEVVEQRLRSDEDVMFAFAGCNVGDLDMVGNFAYAITTKRILMGKKKIIGEVTKSILLEHLNDVTFKKDFNFYTITIDTIKEKLVIRNNRKINPNIELEMQDVLLQLNK